MLMHHDSRDYNVAASEAAKFGREKLDTLIETGRSKGQALIEKLQSQVIKDYVARGTVLKFDPHESKGVTVKVADKQMEIGRFARGQMFGDVRFPTAYYDHLIGQGDWGKELAAKNLNDLFRQDPAKHRIRTVEESVRGFLSMSYAPRDIGMLLDSFFKACEKSGALPFEGSVHESKFSIRVILPHVFEPVKNEVMSFFLHFGESEFGNGATTLSAGIMRLGCTNKAVFDNIMRKIHLGGSEDFEWNRDTIRAMTTSVAKQVRDIVAKQLSPETVNRTLDIIRRADEEKIGPGQITQFLAKHCNKTEAAGIVEAFNSADTEMMPAGQTRYRFSNAISFFAQKVDDGERTEELQRLAGIALAA